ncbi:MAG: hypothetical protein ABIR62_16615 [Dokdonella sp.]|uniref:hypothetical protein n=1 Tax=Dokdonella sp. TaxID=2291710 RepID=UPI00326462B6
MKHRKVFKVETMPMARQAIAEATAAGAGDDDVLLIARHDIEMEEIPPDRVDATTDMIPAALRGAVGGGVTGLVAGLVALAFPPIGMTIAGAGLLTAAGGLVGTFSASLAGASVPNPIRQAFEKEIAAGAILIVVDIEADDVETLESRMTAIGAQAMPFDSISALS